ncbi:MAG: radical SAM family heme chaperone HemW [Acidobacteriota bacterium]
MGLYVHVPFCTSFCAYCDFYRLQAGRGIPQSFDDLLLAEASLHALQRSIRADTLYLGGGTPSLLPPRRLARLLSALARTFGLPSGAEATLEANPETVTEERVVLWLEAGVNRLSVGVQSFRPELLRRLGRRATASQAARALKTAAAGGFRRLSADLLVGVPGQTLKDLQEDLKRASEAPLDHLSLYALDLHPGTPLHGEVAAGRLRLPTEERTARLWERAHEALSAAGWRHYEISNFARGEGECRHNLKYWRGEEYLGLGPSAWSRMGGVLAGNPRSLERWAREIEAGRIPWETRETLSSRRVREDRLIFGLRLAEGVPLAEVEALFEGRRQVVEELLQRLEGRGLLHRRGGVLALTPRGFLLSSAILAALLPDRIGQG